MWFAWFYCLLLFVGVVCYALRFVVRFDGGSVLVLYRCWRIAVSYVNSVVVAGLFTRL